MNLDIALLDDNYVDRKILEVILTEYFNQRSIDFTIKGYDNGNKLIEDFKNGYSPRFLFADVMLGCASGLEVCRELRMRGYSGAILFLSESKEHAFDCYDVDARCYFLKPYNTEKIYRSLDRILHNSNIHSYVIKNRANLIHVPIYEILYAESQNNRCYVRCEDVQYTVYKKLSTVEEELADHHFLRCHRSYLINMEYVVHVNANNFILKNGMSIPIRRQESKEIKDTYRKYVSRYKI